MNNEEVGVSAETDVGFAENIYLVPMLEGAGLNDIRIFILADGNNRAQLEGKDYDDGGKNVIRIAEHMAERGDVSMMIACILSPENIDKRSDAFFEQIYEAFIKLEMRMKSHGTLLNAGVKVEIAGSLDRLRAKGGSAEKLVNAIEAVMEMTRQIEKPRTRLLLGVDYDPDVAQDKAVNLMFRSGMEEDDSVRSSGIKMHPGIPFYGTTELWPNVTPELIDEVVDDVRKSMKRALGTGYSEEQTTEIMQMFKTVGLQDQFSLTFRSLASFSEVAMAFKGTKYTCDSNVKFEIVGSDGKSVVLSKPNGGEDSGQIVRILADAAIFREDSRDYSTFLVPGQSEQDFFTLPVHPELGYATAIKTDDTPEGVIAGVQRAIDFHRKHVSMKGAEREIEMNDDDPSVIREKAMKLFKGKMIRWLGESNLPLRPGYEKSIKNYVLTSFFLAYAPKHSLWSEMEKQWDLLATMYARYMIIVATIDNEVFDNPKVNRDALPDMTDAMCTALDLRDVDTANESFASILRGLKNLSLEMRDLSGPEAYDVWVKNMKAIFICMMKEYDQAVAEYDEHRLNSDTLPPEIREHCLNLAHQHHENPTILTEIHMKIWSYLIYIEHSIGAGNTFMTGLCADSGGDKVDPQLLEELTDICSISNFFFRVANDSTDFSADEETQDDNYCMRSIFAESEGEIGLEEQITVVKELKQTIGEMLERKVDHFCGKYSKDVRYAHVCLALRRMKIGDLFYDDNHYRKADEDTVNAFFTKLENYGIEQS